MATKERLSPNTNCFPPRTSHSITQNDAVTTGEEEINKKSRQKKILIYH
jgi:hypothetical protein